MANAYAIKIRDKESGEVSYHGRLLYSTRAKADEIVSTWSGPKHEPVSIDPVEIPGIYAGVRLIKPMDG
jgi:hypothetical protein